MLSSKNSQREL